MARTSRRHFAKSLVAAGAALPLAAQTPAPPAPQVCLPYTQHLTPDEIERIRKDFADATPYLETFRKFKLVNADEPDFTFHSLTERW
jgi:hypothetical protein